MSEEASKLHVTVHGRVQGVGFRYFVSRAVEGRPITGWVRNRPDGSVEVVAEGPRPTLEWLLAALHSGPRAAYVTRVDASWSQATNEFARFDLR